MRPTVAIARSARRAHLVGLFGALIALNVSAWVWALEVFQAYPTLIGLAVLAYSFGLRHAIDADHIAAIDNVTRKLMQEGERPASTGLYFSLGHSTVVIVASIALASLTSATRTHLQGLKDRMSLIGTAVSVAFLLAIAITNAVALRDAVRGLPQGRNPSLPGGLLARILQPLFRLVSRSWHMYVLGLLFALGFDTVTEIGVLGIAATQAARGLALVSILIFPLLFTAAMSLVDTLDSTLMVGVYGWALLDPARRRRYNITMIAISVLIAILVASVEGLGLIASHMSARGAPWSTLVALNEHLVILGSLIIALFVACWLAAVAVQRIQARNIRGSL